MILSDVDIRRLCEGPTPLIEPFSEAVSGGGIISWGLSSCGYDLRLGSEAKIMYGQSGAIDVKDRWTMGYLSAVNNEGRMVLPPRGYALGYSMERIVMPRDLCARVIGKSTWARAGLVVNTTPIEPSWIGHITLELFNATTMPMLLHPGEGIAQIQFEQLSSPCERSYADKHGKYQSQGPEPVAAMVD